MNLVMEMDELRKDAPPVKWDLTIPLETRMAMLTVYESYQHEEIQFVCDHKDFKDGRCLKCDFKCDHQETEEYHCLDCGEYVEPFDPRGEPEWLQDR